MKKNIILSLCALVVASGVVSAYDELILLNGTQKVTSVNVDKINSISYSGNGEGYETMNILMDDNTTKSFDLNTFTKMEYAGDPYLSITEDYDEHCEVIVLDNYYNEGSEYADHYHKCLPGNPVHYYYTIEVGYDIEVSIIGDISGTNYRAISDFEFEDDYTGTGSIIQSTAFLMPNEPITIKAVSTEHINYPNASFTGSYTYGFWINETYDNHVLSTSTSMLSAEIKSNGVFEVKSTDSNKYDFKGGFIYDAESKSFKYVENECKTYGLNGNIVTDDFILGTVKNITYDMPENTHFYWLSKKKISFVRATGETRDGKFVIEVGIGNDKKYYFYNAHTYSLSEASATFSRGSSLGEASSAILTLDADPYAIKYTLASTSGKPVIEYAGTERGTYSGSGEKLWLDGFNGAKYGNNEGVYTISGAKVTFTPKQGTEIVFIINQGSMTYEIVDDTAWNGPLYFSTNNPGARIDGYNYYNNSSGQSLVELRLDQEYDGTPAKGKAKFTWKVCDASFADNTVPYTYNPTNNTIIITYDYVYYVNDWVDDNSLVFKVSEDKKSLTLEQGYLSTFAAKGYSWLNGPTVLTAAE